MPAFVAGGLARAASSRSDSAGWRRRSGRRLAQALRQRIERTRGAQPARRLELPLRGPRRAHEICVVGIREPVRLGPHLRDDAPLLQREHRVDDTCREEVALDLLPSLRIRPRVRGALLDLEPDLLGGADAAKNDAPAGVGVRTSRCGERGPLSEPPPRNAPTQIGATATRPCDDAAGRTIERPMLAVRARPPRSRTPSACSVAFDVELVPGRAVERARRVRADLGRHAQLGEKREGASGGGRRGEVEVERRRRRGRGGAPCPPYGRAPRSRRAGRSAASWRDRRELGTHVVDERARAHSETPSSASSRRFSSTPADP